MGIPVYPYLLMLSSPSLGLYFSMEHGNFRNNNNQLNQLYTLCKQLYTGEYLATISMKVFEMLKKIT